MTISSLFGLEKKEREPSYGYRVAYACEDKKHCQRSRNDGICIACADPVRPAVVRHGYAGYISGWTPLRDGFVRWHETDEPRAPLPDYDLPLPESME